VVVKLAEAPEQDVLQSPLAAVQYRCNLPRRCSLEVAKHDRLALSWIEMKQGFPKKPRPFLLNEVGFLTGSDLRGIHRSEFVMVAAAGTKADPVKALVMGDAQEPGLERTGASEGAGPFEDLDENILGYVESVLAASGIGKAGYIHKPLVTFHGLLEGTCRPGAYFLDQHMIAFVDHHSPGCSRLNTLYL
jgi:hypothetical protein